MLYDISPTVRPETPVWPGDAPFSARAAASLAAGDPANVATVTTTLHLGAHVDAPCHVTARGATVEALPLAPFLGACRVVKVPAPALVEPRHLAGIDLAAPGRLLLRTGSVRDRTVFPARYTALAPELARLLAARGVALVGLDTPSVDPRESADLPAHHALVEGGVAILEGLLLDGVPEGVYELIALPLKLAGMDASPVRAVLRTLE
ncbi:MAG TPA: arylformamidase [Thermoanaerobaculia bacterium]|nr:arylformamidase [Thermoanaerobaculia bacterium]